MTNSPAANSGAAKPSSSSETTEATEKKDSSKAAAATIKIIKPSQPLEKIFQQEAEQRVFSAELGEPVEGTVIAFINSGILLELADGLASGLIPSSEIKDSLGTGEDLQVCEKVSAILVEPENENGHYILSLRKAAQLGAWDRFVEALEGEEVFKVRPHSANRGGLVCDIDGIRGFIPVSQLMPEHYPRVEDSTSGMILEKLKEWIGHEFSVRPLVAEPDNGKLLLSEKKAFEGERKKIIEQLSPGQVVKGKVSGFSRFGFFVTIAGGVEGLVHVSEISWEKTEDPRSFAKEGDEVEVVVISAELNRIGFSIRRLTTDPWVKAAGALEIGQKIEGPVAEAVDYGAFIQVTPEIKGLLHQSEFPESWNEKDAAANLAPGKTVTATIISIDLDERRLGLSMKEGAVGKKKKITLDDEDSSPKEKEEKKTPAKKKAIKKEEKKADPIGDLEKELEG
jgi:small subunit ribosomal protein S1